MGFSAVEFAEEVLGFDLMPWQRWLLIHALELRPDGSFRFRTVLVMVARQNGKTTLVEIKNLWKMFVLEVMLVIGTAQTLEYAEESWDKAVEIVEGTPDLAGEVAHVDKTNGKKTLRLRSGSRWKIATASRRGGRSLAADDVNLDELREHQTWDAWAAVTKTTLARRKAQIWAITNAGDDRSVVLNQLQENGRTVAGDPSIDSTVGHFEWSAPEDCPVDDPQMLRMANPSLGYPQGITLEALLSAARTDPEPVFRTECLCQRVPDLVPPKIPLTAWVRCKDAASTIGGGLVLTWEVAWNRGFGAIGVAGFRPDGLPHVELIDYREGTEWLPGRFGEVVGRHSIAAVVYNPSGPGASMLTEVSERLPRRLDPKPMTARDHANACGRIYDATMTNQLRHLGDDRLINMLKKSATRTLVDAWAWDLRGSAGDICGLVAVTDALHGLYLYGQATPPPPPEAVSSEESWLDSMDLARVGF